MTAAFGPPTISLARFSALLAGSPALQERDASAYYATIKHYELDPAFMLAIFKHESGFALNPDAVVVRHATKNWGNTRSNCGVVPGRVIQTDRGPFVQFAQWIDGLHDACARLIALNYPYAQAGARTVEAIIPIWAPAGDMDNSPTGYVAAVVRDMAAWRDIVPQAPTIPKPPVDSGYPSPNRGGYAHAHDPRCLVWHITQGTNSLGWLTNPASGASSNYLIARGGAIFQLVPPTVSAWANGKAARPDLANPVIATALKEGRNLNTVSISIEHEGYTSGGKGGSLTAAQVDATVALSAWLCATHNIPADRTHILGHFQVDAVDRPNCPGFSAAEWDTWIDRVRVAAAPPIAPARLDPVQALARLLNNLA